MSPGWKPPRPDRRPRSSCEGARDPRRARAGQLCWPSSLHHQATRNVGGRPLRPSRARAQRRDGRNPFVTRMANPSSDRRRRWRCTAAPSSRYAARPPDRPGQIGAVGVDHREVHHEPAGVPSAWIRTTVTAVTRGAREDVRGAGASPGSSPGPPCGSPGRPAEPSGSAAAGSAVTVTVVRVTRAHLGREMDREVDAAAPERRKVH